MKTYEFSSPEGAQKFLAQCTDVTVATTQIDGETVIVSSCETTYPCVEGGTRLFVISV